jgi:molecular chaperone DnaJ
VRNPKLRGDQIVTFKVVIPTRLTDKQKSLLKQLAEDMGEGSKKEKFWDKMKKKLDE